MSLHRKSAKHKEKEFIFCSSFSLSYMPMALPGQPSSQFLIHRVLGGPEIPVNEKNPRPICQIAPRDGARRYSNRHSAT